MRTLGRLVCEGIFVVSVVFTVWVNRPTSFVVIAGTALGVLGIVGAVSLIGRRQLLPIRRSSIGSVSGKLEAISIHRGGRFVVYQAVNDKAISCKFEESALDRVKALLGRRVVVSGIVHSNIKAEPIRVDVDEIFDLDAELRPDTRELRGAYPGIADGLSPESYIRRLRGE